MYLKIFIIVTILIVTITFFIYNKNMLPATYEDDTNKDLITSIENYEGKSNKFQIELTREEFNNINVPINKTIYYFPDDCPSYEKEFLLMINNDGLIKYYIPEKKSLIIIDSDHTWTKNPNPENFNIWKKN
jgi:hypothetical protein